MKHSQYLLDTNAVVELMRRPDGKVARHLVEAGGVGYCAISDLTLYELYSGAYASKNVDNNLAAVQRLTQWLAVIPSADGFKEAARQKVELRKQGQMIEDIDILIGSTALVSGRILVTGNVKYFSRLHGLQLENWQQ